MLSVEQTRMATNNKNIPLSKGKKNVGVTKSQNTAPLCQGRGEGGEVKIKTPRPLHKKGGEFEEQGDVLLIIFL